MQTFKDQGSNPFFKVEPKIGDSIKSSLLPGQDGVVVAINQAWWAPEFKYCCKVEGSSLEYNLRLEDISQVL